jgi:uncharacterized SAM-binding protein YcdF (DUF218 family)
LRWLALLLFLFEIGLTATIHVYGTFQQEQSADVIVVLGAGLDRRGRPGYALTRRANRGAALYHAGIAPVVICTGGITGKAPRSEASACGELLRARGVPERAIVLEEQSRSTEENALHTQRIMAAKGWQTAVIVSDSFHVLRANWLFSLAGIPGFPSPVPAAEMSFIEYALAVGREVAALHWQAFKELFNLPVTYVGGL